MILSDIGARRKGRRPPVSEVAAVKAGVGRWSAQASGLYHEPYQTRPAGRGLHVRTYEPGCSTERVFDRASGAFQATGRYSIRQHDYVLVDKRQQPNARIRPGPCKPREQRMSRRRGVRREGSRPPGGEGGREMKGSCGSCDGYLEWPRECPSCLTVFCGSCIGSHDCPMELPEVEQPVCIHGTEMTAFCLQCDEDEEGDV
jgi:hypothetical protein